MGGADIVTIISPIVVPGGVLYFGWKSSKEKLTTVITSNLPEIILGIIIIRMLWKQMKRKKEHRMLQKIVNENYYKLLHDCRNVINAMEKDYKTKALNLQLLSHHVENFAENTLNYLTDTLCEMSGKKICGCVKVIVGDGFEKIRYCDACVKTFARSSNSEISRKTMDEKPAFQIVKINENTDFMSIVAEDRTGNDSVFYQQDLIAFNKQLEKIGDRYRNTTPDWDRYYKATIVVPIRIANKRLFYTKEKGYNILGFLCVDTLDTHTFTRKNKESYTYIVKAHAAALYNILSKYQYYMKRLSGVKNETKEREAD